jgi:hypothetical protein
MTVYNVAEIIAKFFANMRTHDPAWWVTNFNLQQTGIMFRTDDQANVHTS